MLTPVPPVKVRHAATVVNGSIISIPDSGLADDATKYEAYTAHCVPRNAQGTIHEDYQQSHFAKQGCGWFPSALPSSQDPKDDRLHFHSKSITGRAYPIRRHTGATNSKWAQDVVFDQTPQGLTVFEWNFTKPCWFNRVLWPTVERDVKAVYEKTGASILDMGVIEAQERAAKKNDVSFQTPALSKHNDWAHDSTARSLLETKLRAYGETHPLQANHERSAVVVNLWRVIYGGSHPLAVHLADGMHVLLAQRVNEVLIFEQFRYSLTWSEAQFPLLHVALPLVATGDDASQEKAALAGIDKHATFSELTSTWPID